MLSLLVIFVLQAGNDFGDVFDELQYVMPQVMIIKLKVEDPKIIFDPPFREIRDIILRCFSEIIASGDGLTRVGLSLYWLSARCTALNPAEYLVCDIL